MSSAIQKSSRSGRESEASTSTPAGLSSVHAALLGLKGGLIATAVMTVYRMPIFRGLPPTAEFLAKYVGDGEAEHYTLEGLVLHFLYGGVAGGAFGLAFRRIGFETDAARRWGGPALGLGYGLLLSVVGTRIVFEHLLEENLEADEALVFHVGHLVYGLTLGTWVSSKEEFGEVYE